MALAMAIDAVFAVNDHMYPLEVRRNPQLWEILFLRIEPGLLKSGFFTFKDFSLKVGNSQAYSA